jgi:hypothetical protein
MDASELNEKLTSLLSSALRDGVAAGKMSPATAAGVLELHRAEFLDRLRIGMQQQAAKARPPIILPRRVPGA